MPQEKAVGKSGAYMQRGILICATIAFLSGCASWAQDEQACDNLTAMFRRAYSQSLKKPFGVPEMTACFNNNETSLDAVKMILEKNGFTVNAFSKKDNPEYFENNQKGPHLQANDTEYVVGTKKTFGLFPDVWSVGFYFKDGKFQGAYGSIRSAITAP